MEIEWLNASSVETFTVKAQAAYLLISDKVHCDLSQLCVLVLIYELNVGRQHRWSGIGITIHRERNAVRNVS